MKKRILSLILALLFCLGSLPTQALAAEIDIVDFPEAPAEDEIVIVEAPAAPTEEPASEEEPAEGPALEQEPADEPEAGGGGGSGQIVIDFDGNGGEGWTNSLYFYYGDEVEAPECGFTRKYFNFVGWGVDPEGPPMFLPGAPLDIAESMTFYAIWEPLTQEEMNELYAPQNVSVWSQGFSVDQETGEVCTRAELRWNKVEDVEDFTVSLNLGAPDGPRVPGTEGFNISEAEVYWSSCYVWVSAPFLPDGTEQVIAGGAVNGLLDGDTVYATLASSVNGKTCPGSPVSFTVEKPVVQEGDDPLIWFVTEGYGNVEYDDYGVATVTLVKDVVLPAEGFQLEEGTEVHIQMNTHTITGTMIDLAGTPLLIEHLTTDGPVMALFNYAGAELAFDGYGWFNGSGATAGSVTVTFTDKGQLVNDATYSNVVVVNGGVVTDNPWTLEDIQNRFGVVNTNEPVTYEMGRLSEEELAKHIPQNVEVTPLETGLAVSWDTDPEATEAEIYVDVELEDGTIAHYIGPWTVVAPGYGPESYCWLESGGFNYTTIATETLGVDEEQIYTDGYVNGILPNQKLFVYVTHLVGPFWQETPKSDVVSFFYKESNFGKTFNAAGLVDRPCLADGGVLEIHSALDNLIYNGQGQTLDYSVTWNGRTLEKGTEYVGRYSNYVYPGTATLTVIALRPYAGALSKSYTISAIDLASELVTVVIPDDLVYNGSSQTPEPVITCKGYTLKSGTDYNVSYADYTNAGVATATITPGYRKTCVGERVEHFTIAPRSMTNPVLKATLPAARWAWTGEPITPAVTVKWGSKALTEGTDYTLAYANNTAVGTATVTVTGIGNYADTRTLSFEIYERTDLGAAAEIEPIDDLVYNRQAHTPEPVVTVDGKTLRRGLDYGVSYENNVNAGYATVTVSGCGAYTGEASATFEILPAPLEDCVMTLSKSEWPYGDAVYTYSGLECMPKATVKTADNYELFEGTSFTLSYQNNVNAGTATAIATGMGNYAGTLTGTFTIEPMAIETVYTNITNPYYNGEVQEPALNLHHNLGSGTKYMTEGVDYEILGYANNVNAGEATVTVRGLGNYSGEHAFTFNVTPMPVNCERDFTLTYDKVAFYTGSPVDIHIRVKWKLDGRTLVEGTDYTVEYWGKDYEEGNRTDVYDSCSARITFCGNFSGSNSEIYFAIVEAAAVELPVSGLYSGTYWNIDAEGTLTVWGDGATAELSYHDDVAWRPYRSQIKKIVVLQGITKLTAGTFADCRFATEIELPDGLTEISYSVFTGCDSLQKINIPATVTKLNGGTFPDVAGLEIHLPDNISKDNLDSYPNSNKTKFFVKRGSVTDTAICQTYGYFYYEGYPDWMLSYSQNDDQGLVCWKYVGSASDVRVPDFVDGLNSTFASSYLVERVVVPANVRTMGYGNMMPFEYCYGLRELVIEPGDKLTELRSYFFYGCSDLTVYIPDTITSIGQIIQSDDTNILIVANCNSYAIEWAKGQMRWGYPIWADEAKSESQTGPRYRMIHGTLEHHAGTPATCETDGCADWDTCPRCDYTSYAVIPALGHDWGEASYVWAEDNGSVTASRSCKRDAAHTESETAEAKSKVTKAASCEEAGERTWTAKFENPAFAKQTKTETIPAAGHKPGEPVKEKETAAKCTEPGGYDTVVYCTVCGKELSREHTEIPAAGHKPGEPVKENVGVASCGEEGSYDLVVYCTVCGAELSREHVVEVIDHDWGEPTYEWAADFSSVTAKRVCKLDASHVETETVVPTSEVTTEAKCEETGVRTWTATFQNTAFAKQTRTETIPAKGHTPGEPVKENEVAPKCEEAGGYDMVVYCTVCHKELSREHTNLPATGHTPGEPVKENEVAPKCEEAGGFDTVVYCTVCHKELSREHTDLPAVGHTPGEPVRENVVLASCGEEGSYDLVVYCTVCHKELSREHIVEVIDHDWGEPTYDWADDFSSVTAKAVCKLDESHVVTETVVPTSEVTTEAKCEEAGVRTWTAVFESVAFTKQTKTETIPALGHSYGEPVWTWAEDYSAASAAFACANCDDVQTVEAAVTSERTEPTAEADGKIVYTATVEFEDKTYTDVKEVALPRLVVTPELALESSSTSGPRLAWTAAADNAKYQVERKAKGGDWTLVRTTEELAYTDVTAKMGETYAYRVRAEINGEPGEYSNELSFQFNPFSDVSGKKTIEYVAWAFNNGIVNGTSTTTFTPDDPCTRVQFIMMLWKMNGSPIVKGENPFSDISGRKTTNAILWALDAGVINSGDTFDPNGNISRVQIVMILWKLAGSPEVTGENPFTDVSGKKTTKAVLWAYQNGITKGTSATTFAPNADCTRVQLVVFLYKYNGIYHVVN